MKLCLVHDSKFGNGIQVAETIIGQFDQAEVMMGHIRDLKPKDVVQQRPDILIVGTAVRMFHVSWASSRWLKKLNKILHKENVTIPYGLCFITHMREIQHITNDLEGFFEKFQQSERIVYKHPNYILGQVVEVEGPLKTGVIERVTEEAMKFKTKIHQYKNAQITTVD